MANNVNVKAVITAEDRSQAALKGFSNKVTGMGTAVSGAIKGTAIALGTATVAATAFAVKSAASFEQTRIGLENMLGSADQARAVLKQISDFAARTPFEFPELAESVKQLVAFGFSGEDAIKTMKQLGDVSAAIGAPMGDLTYLMGTLRTQGRAFTIDIRQFAQRGIPIYEYLAKVLNTNTKEITAMIEAGQIGFPEVQKAFQAMTSEGGNFHNTMEKQSKSLTGLMSTLRDTIGMTARELVGITQAGDIKQGSLFDFLRQGAQQLIAILPTLVTQMKATAVIISQTFGQSVSALFFTLSEKVIPSIQRLWQALNPALMQSLKIVGAQIWVFINISNALWSAISKVINIVSNAVKWFGNFAGAVINAGRQVAGAFTGVADKIVSPFKTAFNAIVRMWNNSVAKISINAPSWVPGIGGKSFGIPEIPMLAEGGIVKARPGGTLVGLGEGGRDEAVIPLNKKGAMPTGNITLNVNIGMYSGTEIEKRKMAQAMLDAIKDLAASNSMQVQDMLR